MSITLGDAVVYLISDDSQLKAGLANAQGLTDGFAQTMGGSFKSAIGTMMSEAMGLVTSAVQEGVTQFGNFFMGGIEGAINLDQQMANIASTIGKTKAEVAPLKEEIMRLALDPDLVVNTKQAAEAIELLAKNGLEMDQIMGGASKSVVALANATGNDFKLAAATMSDAMKQFGIDASDSGKIIDGMVGVTTNGKFKLLDYSYALAQAGGVAAQVGIPFDEFSTTIAAVSDTFKKGQSAGTALRGMIQSMSNPTDEARAAMEQYGVSLFDAQGKTKPMSQVVQELHDVFSKDVTITNSVTTATDAMGNTIVLTAEKQKELAKAQEEASAKMPDLEFKIRQQTDALEINRTKLEAWAAQGRGALGGDPGFRQLTETIQNQEHALESSRAKLGEYQTALQGVSNANTETTSTTRALSDEEKARLTKLFGGTVAGAQLVADISKMTAEQFNALNEEINKTGSGLQAAATRVDSVQGAFEVLSSVVEAIQIQMADGFLPAIRSVTVAITEIASAAGPYLTGFFSDIGQAISTQVDSWLGLGRNIATVFAPLQAVADVATTLPNSMLGSLSGVKGLSDGLTELQKSTMFSFGATTGLITETGKNTEAFYKAKAAIDNLLGAGATDFFLQLAASAREVGAAFREGGLSGALNELFNQLSSAVPTLIENLGQRILSGASSLLGYTTQLLQSIPQALASFAPDAESAKQLGVSLAQAILSAFNFAIGTGGAASNSVSIFLDSLFKAITAASGAIWDIAYNLAQGFFEGLNSGLSASRAGDILGKIGFSDSEIVKVTGDIAKLVSESAGIAINNISLGDSIFNLITRLGQALLGGASSLLSYTTQLLQSIPQALANFAPDAESAQQLGTSLAQSILSAFGLAVSSGEAVSSPLGEFFKALGTAAMSMSGVLFEVATNVASGFLAALQERFTTIDVSGIFGGLMGVLGGGAVASAFASLAASITPMLPILTSISAGFSSFMAILAPLTTLISTSLAPIIAVAVAELASMGATFGIFFGSFASGLPFVSSIGAAFTWLITAITPLATFLAPITAALGSVGLGFAALINPITLAGVAIIGLGALWGSNSEQMNGIAKQIQDYLLPTFENLKQGFAGFVANLGPALPALEQLFNTFIAAIPSMQIMAGVVIGGLVGAIGKLGDVLAAILPSLGMVIGGLVTGLSGALSGAIQFVDGAVQMIYNLLTGDLGKAREGALDVMTGLASGIGAILSGFGQIAIGLVMGLAEGITAAMPDLGAALESMASYIVETAMDLLGVASPSTIFADIGLNLIEGLIEGIGEAADSAYSIMEEVVTTLIDTTLEIIESGASGLAEAWGAAWDVVAESTSQAIDGVIEYVGGLADGAIELIGSAMDTIGELWDSGWSMIADLADGVIGTITDIIDSFTSDGEGMMDTFMTAVGELWDSGWSAIYELADSVISEIYSTLDSFSSDANSTWDSLTANLSEIWDSAWAMMTEALASATETIGGYIDSASATASSIWDALGNDLSALWGAAWSFIADTMSNASGTISGLMGGAQSTLSSIWQALSDGLNTAWALAWGLIQSAGESAWLAIGSGVDTLSSGLQTIWETVSSVISTVWETAWSMIGATYERVSAQVKTGIESLRDGVTTAMSSTTETISTMWNTVWEVAGRATTAGKTNIISLVSDFLIGARQKFDDFKDKWIDAGKMMMSGVMDGLELMRDDFIDMFEELAWAALRRVKEVLGMQSPSTVFRDEVGVQMVAGMTEGMEQESGSMFDTIGNIAGGAVDAAVRGISGARDAIGGIFGGAFGEYISNNMTGQIQQATETAAINMEGVIAGLRQSADLNYIANTNKKASWDNVKNAVRSETADAIKLLNDQYQQMLTAGMNPEEALAKYNEAAKQAQAIIETAALKNSNIAHGGQDGGVSGIFGEIGTEINKAIEAAKVMKDNQLGLRDVFDFSMGSVQEELKVNLDSILNQAKTTVENLSATYKDWNKSNGSPDKVLKDMGDAAIKGITDSSKEMVKQTKDLLAAGMSPQEAMRQYVEMTNQAYQVLGNDTLIKKLPDTVREGKQVLSEAYKDILDTLDSQFIGGTNAKLKQAGNLFKQGLADGIDASTLVSVFNDQMTAIKKTTEDTFIQGMPGTLAKANDLLDSQYRTMKNDLEKGLVTNTKAGMKSAGEALTQGLKDGLDPAQLIADYKAAAAQIQGTFTNELVALVPEGVKNATAAIDDASAKLLGSLQKDFVGGVKGGLSEAESALKKGFSNMTDPAQAQGFIDAYIASVKEIKESFKGGVASMIPDALKDAQGLTSASAEKMAGDISKNFIKASKDKFKDMNEELKKSLEKGIDPTTIMMNFRDSAAEINKGMYNARSAIANGLGQIVPKDLAGMDIVPELDKAKADIEKSLTTNIKNKLGDAASTMKEGVKKGLDLTELVASYRQSAEELRKQTSGTEFGKATGAAVEAQLKATKDYIENEFGKQVKDDIKGITTGLKNSLTLGDSPAIALANYQKELAKVNGFIGGELGKSMPEAMAAARESVTANYEDVFGAIAKQAKGSLGDAKNAFKEALASGIDPTTAMADYQAVASGITSVISNELGKNAPLAIKAAKDELEDSLKAVKELLKKNLVTDVKDQMSDASKAFKEGLKEGLPVADLKTAYDNAVKAASESAKGLADFPAAMQDTNDKIASTTNDMMNLLKNNLVAGVKEKMGSLKSDLKENMDFGGTVAEALKDLSDKTGKLKDEFAKGLGGEIPGAIEAANALIDEQKAALLKNLGGKFVGELKDAIKEQSEVMKQNVASGMKPSDALDKFKTYMATVMTGMTKELTDATPNLKRMADGLVAEATTELSKLGGLAAPTGLSTLGKSLLGVEDAAIKAAKEKLKQTLDFGGTVTEALAQFKADLAGIGTIVNDEIGKKAPEALSQAQDKFDAASYSAMQQLAAKYVAQIKEFVKTGEAARQGLVTKAEINPLTGAAYTAKESIQWYKSYIEAEIAKIPKDIATAIPGAMDEARQVLATKLGDLTLSLPPALSTLAQNITGATVDATSTVTAAVKEQMDLAKSAIGSVVSGANTSTGSSGGSGGLGGLVKGATDTVSGVKAQGDEFLVSIKDIGNGLVTLLSGDEGILAQIDGSLVSATTTVAVNAKAYGQAIKKNFTDGLNAWGFVAALSAEDAPLQIIPRDFASATLAIAPVALNYGATISSSIAEGIANGSQGIYDNLSLITTRVNSDMASVNATIASAQANSNAALAAVGQAAQQMITNANNAVTTTNNNNNIVINNPVPQPAAMDLMMIRNMSDR